MTQGRAFHRCGIRGEGATCGRRRRGGHEISWKCGQNSRRGRDMWGEKEGADARSLGMASRIRLGRSAWCGMAGRTREWRGADGGGWTATVVDPGIAGGRPRIPDPCQRRTRRRAAVADGFGAGRGKQGSGRGRLRRGEREAGQRSRTASARGEESRAAVADGFGRWGRGHDAGGGGIAGRKRCGRGLERGHGEGGGPGRPRSSLKV
jgi:hypothetical protein